MNAFDPEDLVVGCDTPQAAIAKLWFRGIGDDLEDPSRAGDVDGVLWLAESPSIAQCYIPCAGLTEIVAAPSPWQMGEGIRPNLNGFWPRFAAARLGLAYREVERDALGDAVSWAFAPGARVTYGEAFEALKAMGYSFESGIAEVKSRSEGGATEWMRADWRLTGSLLATPRDPRLNLLDISTGESDLTARQYHRIDLFRRAETEGYDGIVIDDFAQSDSYGNVGHRSVGLFDKAARARAWIVMDAEHPDLDDARRRGGSTPEFDDWFASVRCGPSARP